MDTKSVEKLGYQIMMTISKHFGPETNINEGHLSIVLGALCSTTGFFIATKSDEDGLEDYIGDLREMASRASAK